MLLLFSFCSVSHSFVQSREHAYTLIFYTHSLQNAFFFVEKRDYLELIAHTTLFFVFQLIGRHQHHRLLLVRAATIFSAVVVFPVLFFYTTATATTTTKLILNIFLFCSAIRLSLHRTCLKARVYAMLMLMLMLCFGVRTLLA